MKISMYDMAVGTFVPMLESLSSVLRKGDERAKAASVDLVNARLAPDMFTLTQQVQQACHYAKDAVSRLSGKGGVPIDATETSFAGFTKQIEGAVNVVRDALAADFDGAEDRDCSIDIPGEMVIEMNGLRLLRAWSLPHFYFHVVTAYDILRHHGVVIGKQDYLSQVGSFIRPKQS
jgi:hypothetical protein